MQRQQNRSQDEQTTDQQPDIHGVIDGDAVKAFQIIAGSPCFESDNYVQITAHYDGIKYQTVSLDDVYTKSVDALICGTYRYLYNQEPCQRVQYQLPYDASDGIRELNDNLDAWECTFERYPIPTWEISAEYTDVVVSDIVSRDFNIVARVDTIQTLFEEHPTITITESGVEVDSDELIDPSSDNDADDSSTPARDYSGDRTKYLLEAGKCPVPTCSAEFDEFHEVIGHIGGKCNGGDRQHELARVQLDQFEITQTINN